jgi:hypothetical protein
MVEGKMAECTKYVHIKSTTVYAPRRNWVTPQPPTRRLVCPSPLFLGGGEHSPWRDRGWESPNSDEGHTLWYSLYVRTLWQNATGRVTGRRYHVQYNCENLSRSCFYE